MSVFFFHSLLILLRGPLTNSSCSATKLKRRDELNKEFGSKEEEGKRNNEILFLCDVTPDQSFTLDLVSVVCTLN